MEQINGHMYFRNVLGSIAPVDPPTVEQTADCLGYAFRKWRVQRRCFISPSGGMTAWSAIIIHNFETTEGPVPKNSRKWPSSVLASLIALPALLWMSFPPRRKSLAMGLVILFWFFELLSSMWRGGWEEHEQVKRGGGRDCQDDQRREESHAGEREQACSCCLCTGAWYHTLSREKTAFSWEPTCAVEGLIYKMCASSAKYFCDFSLCPSAQRAAHGTKSHMKILSRVAFCFQNRISIPITLMV